MPLGKVFVLGMMLGFSIGAISALAFCAKKAGEDLGVACEQVEGGAKWDGARGLCVVSRKAGD